MSISALLPLQLVLACSTIRRRLRSGRLKTSSASQRRSLEKPGEEREPEEISSSGAGDRDDGDDVKLSFK